MTTSLVLLSTLAVAARERPTVRTSLGAVRGNALPLADEFLGVPYGDAERFKPAKERTSPFEATPLDASYYGPACLQTLTANTTYGVEHGCHVMNFWRPAQISDEQAAAGLPVIVFIPGGSNDFGEAEPYNASVMATNHAALVCSINYRVGPFGFLAFADDAAAGRETGNQCAGRSRSHD